MASTTIIILMLFFTQGSLGHDLQQSPIVGIAGGHPVKIEDAPFMAALTKVDSLTNMTMYWCGGSIIHQQFVLTAAHCLRIRNFGDTLIVRVGSTDSSKGKLYEVDKYIIHENFHDLPEESELDFDVGLIKLSEPLTLSTSVKIIKLADETFNIPVGLTGNVTGWGDTEMTKRNKNLFQASVAVSPAADCTFTILNVTRKINDALQICVKNNYRGAGHGDGGVPLTAGDRQIGIMSGGAVLAGYIKFFAKVPAYLQWINAKINENL